ncbi:hypothetical protein EX350_22390 [Mycobacterium avium subsp. hominissuis]|uniref:hypothetical protein n=1 Tax=Mycobacterium avium TaxID=1764 RepID=UPI0010438623|nr:hypothetical protein [Mycobacterium avium]QBI69851.1 hypothetical protein EX350_22390 [Mycobacterium avium subsp. hominissuis]
MIWVTHLEPVPGEEQLVKTNFSDWKYAIDPSGALNLTNGKEKVVFGPGFWVRIGDDTGPPKRTPAKVHRVR